MVEMPKYYCNSQSAAKPLSLRYGEGSETIPLAEQSAIGVRRKYGVGEIPLNGNGVPLTSNVEGEEIVQSHVRA